MSILYTKDEVSTEFSLPTYVSLGPQRYARELRSTRSVIDVAREFPWTLTPPQSRSRLEVPYISLNEYYMVENNISQQLRPYGLSGVVAVPDPNQESGFQRLSIDTLTRLASESSKFSANTDQLYAGLYDLLRPSGFRYKLPLFTPEMFSLSNSWEKKDILDTIIEFQRKGMMYLGRGATKFISRFSKQLGKGTSKAGGLMEELPEIIKQANLLTMQATNPAVGLFDPPHIFRQSSPRQYSFNFILFNISSYGDGEKQVNDLILQNWELCYILSYQNSFNKRNFYTALPPVYYQVTIPGAHYCKASYMSNLKISNIGNVRKMRMAYDGGPERDIIIPDAFLVEITMQDLLMPSKNLLRGAVSTTAANRINVSEVDKIDRQPGEI